MRAPPHHIKLTLLTQPNSQTVAPPAPQTVTQTRILQTSNENLNIVSIETAIAPVINPTVSILNEHPTLQMTSVSTAPTPFHEDLIQRPPYRDTSLTPVAPLQPHIRLQNNLRILNWIDSRSTLGHQQFGHPAFLNNPAARIPDVTTSFPVTRLARIPEDESIQTEEAAAPQSRHVHTTESECLLSSDFTAC